MHQSFVTTAPPPMGKGREYDFSVSVPCFKPHQCPAISPTPRGCTGGQNFALCPALSSRKSPCGKDPNVKTASFPLLCRDTQKVFALYFSPAIHHPYPVEGGAVITNEWCTISNCPNGQGQHNNVNFTLVKIY